MQRSYLVKSPVHFADFGFFVKVGDMLVHDTSNSNRLTVYRNGEVVKAIKQTTLGLAAMQKSGFIEEVIQQVAKAVSKPVEAIKPPPKREELKLAPKPALAPSIPVTKPEYDKLKEAAKKPEPKSEDQKLVKSAKAETETA
jgi:hypothetical protein